jgi:sugar/nucleoside kinase (ribokinase family)
LTVDVVCTGPVFLDLTFEGLDALPAPGEEHYASDLHATPGGAAITAIGLARLGLRTAIAAPLGDDLPGELVRRQLEVEGVVCAGATAGRTPVAAVLPVGGERAFVTFEPATVIDPSAVERLRPRAVVAGLDALELARDGVSVYAGAGHRDAERHASSLPAGLGNARALLVNRAEALLLTGERDADDAALALAAIVATAVITLGAEGAVAAEDEELVTVAAPQANPRDTTGAGDLFMAAYVWGDLSGLPLPERLQRAAVYASLSVRTATGAASAPTRGELERAIAQLETAIVHESTAKELR